MSEEGEVTLETVLQRENLRKAWMAVRSHDGVAGVDRKTIEATAEPLKARWPAIREKLTQV